MTKTDLDAWKALLEVQPGQADHVLSQLRKAVFVPHDGGQQEVMDSETRFRVLRAGRRWGKTELAAHEVIVAALSKPNQMVWWVANSDKNVRRGYRKVKSQLPRMLLAKDPPSDAANDRILSFNNGSQIEFYTAGTPDSLAGEGVDFVVMDEAALIPENVWFQLVRPTLSDKGGRALIISTPRGRNWFYQVWQRGQDGHKAYESWHFPSSNNPLIDLDEVDDARASLPDLLFQQEYLANFVDNAASIFTLQGERQDGTEWSAVRAGLVPPQGWVTLGIDLAKKEDFTVISGCNSETREPCILERYNEVSWPIQEEYIVDIVRGLQADPAVEGLTVVVDSTGIGDVVFDHLEDRGLDVIPVNFASGHQKERMVRLLAADLEHGRAFVTEEERKEFEHYEYEITKNGRYTFSAPPGQHDDMVAAKMLQNWGVVHEAPPGVQVMNPADPDPEDLVWDEPEEPEGQVTTVTPDSTRSIALRPDAWY
jgi:phage FluMu gp28-like protein